MLVERLLVDVIGVPWSHAHVEADLIGPAVSARVEDRIASLLGDPGTCPHGNPIPGSTNPPRQAGAVPLTRATGLVSVARVTDDVEEDVVAMELLESSGILPGRVVEVGATTEAGVVVLGSGAEAVVPADVAGGVFVMPCLDAT